MINQFKKSLTRSKSGFLGRLEDLFGSGELNGEFYEELEETLVAGDVGVQTAMKLVDRLKEEVKQQKIKDRETARELLGNIMIELLNKSASLQEAPEKPCVVLLVGVNGSGKTTSAAKLARYYREQGKKVLLVAGDTFRAAAIEQLEIWAERAGADLIKQQPGSDASALYFDAMNAARAREYDVVVGDTAGRLQSRYNLMEELNKIYRVVNRNTPGAPHEVLLVLDATTGQNAVSQAKSFNEALPINGIVLAKLDGTARGGIVIAIQDELNIPVRFIGTGEKIEDFAPFDPAAFVHALLHEK